MELTENYIRDVFKRWCIQAPLLQKTKNMDATWLAWTFLVEAGEWLSKLPEGYSDNHFEVLYKSDWQEYLILDDFKELGMVIKVGEEKFGILIEHDDNGYFLQDEKFSADDIELRFRLKAEGKI
jgi:hypothetical protein